MIVFFRFGMTDDQQTDTHKERERQKERLIALSSQYQR
jgi:hypothetical protein